MNAWLMNVWLPDGFVELDPGAALHDFDGGGVELGAGAAMAGEHLAGQLRDLVLRGAIQHGVDALA